MQINLKDNKKNKDSKNFIPEVWLFREIYQDQTIYLTIYMMKY